MKIDFSKTLLQLNGQPVRKDTLCHPQTVMMVQAVINESLKDFPEQRALLITAINKHFGDGLTLQEALCDALTSAYTGPQGSPEHVSGIDRTKRVQLAIRCNKRGMVKIGDDDIKLAMPLVEKKFMDSLVSVQVESLLRGNKFELTAEDEEDEAPKLAAVKGDQT